VLARVAAFRQGMEALGWTENRNILVEHKFAGGDFARIHAHTTEAVGSAPDVIAASSTPIIAALKEATGTIPIVFSVLNDPVGQGFVASLSRPGGNITGFTFIDFPLIGKWLEMLEQIAPGSRRVGFVFNPQSTPFYPRFLHEFGSAPASLAIELSPLPVRDEAEIEAVMTALAREPGGGLILAPDVYLNARRRLIMALAEKLRLPAIYGFRQFVSEGALISYGPDTTDIVRRSAAYVDRILRGEKPANLPVQAPSKFELVINLKVARALGLTVPDSLLALADEVIE
jgi:putative tryptophan/tyrosine transport system substrate-binding protein